MIFYRAEDANGLVHWLTVQAEAKAIDRMFEEHDIDTTKPAMKTLLNDCAIRIHDLENRISSLQDELAVAVYKATEQPIKVDASATEPTPVNVVDWLLNTATQPQVENVFSAIGCRWGEARNQTNDKT